MNKRRPPTSDPRGYCWVNDVATYQRMSGLIDDGLLPVLLPKSEERSLRWAQVLSWYGLACLPQPPSSPVRSSPIRSSRSTRDGHLVVSLDLESSAPARFYAYARRRPFKSAESEDQLLDFLDGGEYQSLLIFGSIDKFTRPSLRKYSRQLKVPWGIFTARDLPGLTFVIAKQISESNNKPVGEGVADAINGKLRFLDRDAQFGPSEPLTRDNINKVICQIDWQTLAINAHGEGGHVTLSHDHSVVLCGLLDREEMTTAGQLVDGCRVDGAGRHCKRVTHPYPRVSAFWEIRAKRLLLFTCNGFSLVDELYQSNISAILSASEGYSGSIMASPRLIFPDVVVSEVALKLLQGQIGPGATLEIINDLHERRSGFRPYVLFGDPCGSEPEWQQLSRDEPALAIRKRHTTALARINPSYTDTVLGIAGSVPEVRLVVGNSIVAILSSQSHCEKEITLTDQTSQLKDYKQGFAEIAKRLDRAQVLERAIARVYRTSLDLSTDFQKSFSQLCMIRVQLDHHVDAASRLCDAVRSRGVWDDALGEHSRMCSDVIGLWDRAFAGLFADHLGKGGHVFNVLGDRYSVSSLREGGTCDYCGTPLCKSLLVMSAVDGPDRYRVSCPVCGDLDTWREDTKMLKVEPLMPMRPGTHSVVRAEIVGPPLPLPMAISPGVVAAEVRDKGTNNVLFRTVRVEKSSSLVIDVPVPTETTPELHTLQLALVHCLDISLSRRRWPAYPSA